MSNVMADRRDAPRYPLIVMAEVTQTSTGAKLIARTSDISRTGCYVDSLNPVAKGEQIHLRLINRSESFETDALVVYVSPGLGMGLRFAEFVTEKQIAILDSWLAGAAKLR